MTALYLYTAHDYRVFKSALVGERLGQATARYLTRMNIGKIIRGIIESGQWDKSPIMIRTSNELLDIFEEIQELISSSTAEEVDLGRLGNRLDTLADDLATDASLHIDMAIEALEILPPANRPAWWGDQSVPGVLGEPPADTPIYGTKTIKIPYFRSVTTEYATALYHMTRQDVPTGAHPAVVMITNSTGRDVCPFSAFMLERELLYPPGAGVFDVLSRYLTGTLEGEGFEYIIVNEADGDIVDKAGGDRQHAALPVGPQPAGEQGPDEAQISTVRDAVSAAPAFVRPWLRGPAAPTGRSSPLPAQAWVRARVRYLEEAERFERRLGRYLGGHKAANEQLGLLVHAVWSRAVAAGRWKELGSTDPSIDGTVGVDRDRLQAVVDFGNLRERMAMLWVGGRLISDLLGRSDPDPALIAAERADRLVSEAMKEYEQLRKQAQASGSAKDAELLAEAERALRVQVRPEDADPALSPGERALMPDGAIPWISGASRWDLPMSSALQSTAEVSGGLVRAGTSGSTYRLLIQAVGMRDAWGVDVDLGLVRLALIAEMLPLEHHSLHEIMAATQLVLQDLAKRSTPSSAADLEYHDNWGRYWHIAPLTEEELRHHVAVDGKFPDEHAFDSTGWPVSPSLSDTTVPADAAVGAGVVGRVPVFAGVADVPVTQGQWWDRRAGARAARLSTEVFDPSSDPVPGADGRLDGRWTLVRADVRRVQARSGRWVRDLSVVLPVRPGEGFTPGSLPVFQAELNALLDEYVNAGYVLPVSGDQLHVSVELVPADKDTAGAVELSRHTEPGRSDQLHWRLHTTTAQPATAARDLRTVLHEILHFTGVTDRYYDPQALFRNHPRKAYTTGLMADPTETGNPTGLPADYLTQIETATSTGPVLHDHPHPHPHTTPLPLPLPDTHTTSQAPAPFRPAPLSGAYVNDGEGGSLTQKRADGEPAGRFLLGPTGARLALLARTAGVHTDPGPLTDEQAVRTLRLVETLRLLFGQEVENDMDDPHGSYSSLLAGIGAVDAMWSREPLGFAVPLGVELLERVALGVEGQPSPARGGSTPEAAVYRRVLALMLEKSARQPGARLTEAADLPVLASAVRLMAGPVSFADASDEDRSELFWATVKGLELFEGRSESQLLTLARNVLHLPADAAWGQELGNRLIALVLNAARAGRDVHDPAALAAYDLELRGALSEATAVTGPGGTVGRDWTGRLAGQVEAAVVERAGRDRTGALVSLGTRAAPWSGLAHSGNSLYLVFRMRGDVQWPDGSRTAAPSGEVLLHLMRHDPLLLRLPLRSPVVLAYGRSAFDTALSVTAARTLGRSVFAFDGRMALSASSPRLVLPDDPGRAARWALFRPDGPTTWMAPALPASPLPSDRDPAAVIELLSPHEPEPGAGSQPDDAADPRASAELAIERQLDLRRPPRLDRSLPPAPLERDRTAFDDGSRMPAALDGIRSLASGLPAEVLDRSVAFGSKGFVLRGVDQVVAEVERELTARPSTTPRPLSGKVPVGTGLLAELRYALSRGASGFTGDGRDFVYTNSEGRVLVLTVRVRHYGRWERFAHVGIDPGPVAGTFASHVTTGRQTTVSTAYRINPLLPLAPLSKTLRVFGRLGLRLGYRKAVTYTMSDRVRTESEAGLHEGSHVYLDDAYFDVSVRDENGQPVGASPAAGGGDPVGGRSDGATDGRRPGAFGFALRDGLVVRLHDSATTESDPGPIPPMLTFDRQPDYRLVGVEDFGPVRHIRDWAVGQIDAKPGSHAFRELDAFFSSTQFLNASRMMSTGMTHTPQLFADDRAKTPLGLFTVRVVPKRAVLLDESTTAVLRDIIQAVSDNSRGRTKGRTEELNAALGPAKSWFGLGADELTLRWLVGIGIRFGHGLSRTTITGGTGAERTASQVNGVPTGLYLVEKTVAVRRTGRDLSRPGAPEFPEGQFSTWSLDRMSRAEARRLAGWDDGTSLRLRSGAGEPYAPAYLTEDRPPTLGGSRVEVFTFPDGTYTDASGRTMTDQLAERILEEAARVYPGLVAPLDQLHPDNPRWRSRGHFSMVVANTVEVLNAVTHQRLAANIEALTSTGLRIGLRDSGPLGSSYRYLWLDGTLTGRTYHGTAQSGHRTWTGTVGAERFGQDQETTHDLGGGPEATVLLGRRSGGGTSGSPFFSASGVLFLGATGGGTHRQGRTATRSAGQDRMLVANRTPHLYGYQLDITVSSGGFWRPPAWLRGSLLAGLLGTQTFVRSEKHTQLIGTKPNGDPAGGGPLKGRVLLSVPAEHTPAADPHVDGADNPYRDLDTGAVTRPMSEDRARGLALRTPDALAEAATRPRQALEAHPYMPVRVVAHPALGRAIDAVLDEASGGSWHLTQQGAPAHDAAVRPFEPQYLTANADQSLAATGWHVNGLWAKGPYLNREAVLAHRMGVSGLRVLSAPAPHRTDLGVVSNLVMAGADSTGRFFVSGGRITAGLTRRIGSGVNSAYSLNANPLAYSSAVGTRVTRTVHVETIRIDQGHQVLVAGTAEHEIAAVSSALGTLRAADGSLVPRALAAAAGRTLEVPGGWLGTLPERSALELGLIRDGFGPIPRYDARAWSAPEWLMSAPQTSYPVTAPDTSAVLAEFDRRLRELSLDDESRDQVVRMVSARVVRGMRTEMTGGGITAPARIGRWGWTGKLRVGGRSLRVRVELVPGESRFEYLGSGVSVRTVVLAIETDGRFSSRVTGADFGIGVAENALTHQTPVSGTGPSYSETGSTRRATAVGEADFGVNGALFQSGGAYAEHTTAYRLRLTLEVGEGRDEAESSQPGGFTRWTAERAKDWTGRRTIVQEGDAGAMRQHTSLSLMQPVPVVSPSIDDPLAAQPELPAVSPPLSVPLPATGPDGAWRRVEYPDGSLRPFVPPERGFRVVGVFGGEHVRAAGVLALAKAYDPRFGTDGPGLLEQAENIGLTRVGTGSAAAVDAGTNPLALTAFFQRSLEGTGYRIPGLTEDSLLGRADGELVLYSRPSLRGARLLTVHGELLDMDLGAGGRATASATGTTGMQSQEAGVGVIAFAPPTGTFFPGLAATGANAGENEAALRNALTFTETEHEHGEGRYFVFALPTSWVSVASVNRRFADSRVGEALLSPFRKAATGSAGGGQAYQAEAGVIAWIREDVARELGLITDTNFPERVSTSWDAVTEADEAWTRAHEEYLSRRRELGTGPWQAVADAQAVLDAATQTRIEAERDPGTAPDGETAPAGSLDVALAREREAVAALEAVRADFDAKRNELGALQKAAEDLAAEYHRVRYETDRLTRWHQFAATEGGRARLGDTPEPAAVTFDHAIAALEDGKDEQPRFTASEEDGTTLLTSPEGTEYRLLDVPRDGDSFFHALAEGLYRGSPGALAGQGIRPTGGEGTAAQLRRLLAGRLAAPDNADLLAFLTPDTPDTFTVEQLVAAGVHLGDGTPQRREFDALGILPASTPLAADARLSLGSAQILRPGSAEDDAGWDHGAADLLPALAARTFGVPVRVVREDGTLQEFAPADAANTPATSLVLRLDDKHYQLAVAKADGRPAQLPPVGADTGSPAEEKPGDGTPKRPAYATPPWAGPDGEAAKGARYDAAADHRTLKGPDGQVYDLVEGVGDGNRFYAALVAASADRPAKGALDAAGRLSRQVAAMPWPTGEVRLAPDAEFSSDEVSELGLRLDTDQQRDFDRRGGRLPRSMTLDMPQREGLVRTQIRAARRWDAGTEGLAAEMTARARRIELTVVHEDGTFDRYPADGYPGVRKGAGREVVTLYRRGDEYLAARPRTPAGELGRPAAEPPVVYGEGPSFALALAHGLRRPPVRRALKGDVARASWLSGRDTAEEDFETWLGTKLTAETARRIEELGHFDARMTVTEAELRAAGIELTLGQQIQMALKGGEITVEELRLDSLQRLRLLLKGPDSLAAMLARAALVSRELGVVLVIWGPGSEVNRFGDSDSDLPTVHLRSDGWRRRHVRPQDSTFSL
ncbi:hypothetical protein AB0D38_10070 [Streptomyces sp. NPDC048279]|uniref:hypothetical protein n=1 Tax=Streptomyces sp. NPDC048279 TaxID=3154714 RepID=UPI00342B6EE7